jgi:hypothetical protein
VRLIFVVFYFKMCLLTGFLYCGSDRTAKVAVKQEPSEEGAATGQDKT